MTTKRWQRVRASILALAATLVILAFALGMGVVANRIASRPGNVFAVMAILVVVLLAVAAVAATQARRVPPRTVLLLDLSQPLVDRDPADPVSLLAGRGRPGLRDVLQTLERAACDTRVAGLVVRIGVPAAGLADVQELRGAVLAFRQSGKHAVAFAETFGDFAGGAAAYYLATAFDEVALQPSGDVGLTGVAMDVTFLRGALDKLGVVPRLDHRHEYKSARNLLTETGFTPAHREASQRIVDSHFDQLVAGIAAGRGLDETRVRQLIDRGPVLGTGAVDAGLVDRLAYRDEVLEDAQRHAGDGSSLRALSAYRARTRSPRRERKAPVVALISGAGAIVQGRSRVTPLTTRAMGADTISDALRRARRDAKVKAILFRVDSPGGSYVASDAIWREVVRAREAGTPVVVSMGNVAGSGGYFVSMAADRIVAHPATITGSIGVVGGKAVLAGLKAKAGLVTEAVARGDNALMWSSSHDYTPAQWHALQRWLDRCYDDFTAKVARGRSLDRERVHEIARGRIWTGADARELGLVDTLGGYPQALACVREVMGLAAEAPVRLAPYPPRRSLRSRLTGGGPSPDEPSSALGGLDVLARDAGLLPGDALVTMPGLGRVR